ncbi:hypothetical protein [Nonomuraea rubra]|uniref:hypothetical protein n=1 Tax=Nonomuraea rubra TaxID=46180 RepID=UPI003410F4F5
MLASKRGLPAATAGIALTGGALTWALGSWSQGRRGFARTTNFRLGTALVAVLIALTAVWVAIVRPLSSERSPRP